MVAQDWGMRTCALAMSAPCRSMGAAQIRCRAGEDLANKALSCLHFRCIVLAGCLVRCHVRALTPLCCWRMQHDHTVMLDLEDPVVTVKCEPGRLLLLVKDPNEVLAWAPGSVLVGGTKWG